jgi:hypothetical protein
MVKNSHSLLVVLACLAEGCTTRTAASNDSPKPVTSEEGEPSPAASESGIPNLDAIDAGDDSLPPTPIERGVTLATGRIYNIAAAAADNAQDAALLFEVYGQAEGTSVRLQPFTWDGVARGDPVELSPAGPRANQPGLDIASDGERFVACWDTDTNVKCSAINPAGGAIDPVLDVPGRGPAVAYSRGTWLVAYVGDPTNSDALTLQPLSSTFELGDRVTLGNLGPDALPALNATNDGFLLLDTDPANGYDFRTTRLDVTLKPSGDSLAWGIGPWMTKPALFVDDAQVVLGTPLAYGAQVSTRSADVDSSIQLSGGGKEGVRVAFVDDGTGPLVCWLTPDGAVGRKPVATLDPTAPFGVGSPPTYGAIVSLQLGARQAVIVTTNGADTDGFDVKLVPFE